MLPTARLLSPHKVNPPPSLTEHLSAWTRPAPALSSALNGSHCELGVDLFRPRVDIGHRYSFVKGALNSFLA